MRMVFFEAGKILLGGSKEDTKEVRSMFTCGQQEEGGWEAGAARAEQVGV